MNDHQRLMQRAITPKKSLGQNFLHDPHTLEKIVASAELTRESTVLEIGPGTGNLTRLLARAAGRVIAVELDDRLVPLLQEEFAGQSHVSVLHADILAVDLGGLVGSQPYSVVANLPYYITSAIVRHLLEQPPRPQRIVITVQREVAERMVAAPGEMSLLAVSVQFYGTPHIVMRLSPGVFWPRPDVESAVVRVDVANQPRVAVPDERLFFRVVKAGFGQKRKQLRNALSSGLGVQKPEVDALLDAAHIDPQRRAETLSLDEWAGLSWAVHARNL